ncbi:TetR-like C-terminal domain-containing protein, partial [Mycolicibacterium sphagni]|uniref:TetR-like C-terminal domain-containing protein n=1 Tax=Mycolicibacterium sphagni TaxID=1786 RepID=UPI0021F2638B
TGGYRLLATALTDARPRFVDAATAYVRFAIDHPGHYAGMFDHSLLDMADTELDAAQSAAGAELARGVATLADPHAVADPTGAELAAWSLVHGFATLWLNNAVPPEFRDVDPVVATERIANMLFDG